MQLQGDTVLECMPCRRWCRGGWLIVNTITEADGWE